MKRRLFGNSISTLAAALCMAVGLISMPAAADTKLRVLNEMLQYTQPKLKSVEMKVSGNLELTAEQLDNRLAMFLSRAARK